MQPLRRYARNRQAIRVCPGRVSDVSYYYYMPVDVPPVEHFVWPLLLVLACSGKAVRSRDAYTLVATHMHLSAHARSTLLPTRRRPVFENRTTWAYDRLRRVRYAYSPKRGHWQLTAGGRAFVKANPHGISDTVMRKLGVAPLTSSNAAEELDAVIDGNEGTDAAIQHDDARLRRALQRLAQTSPSEFEDVVVQLLRAMRYGRTNADVHLVGGSGDGGIDAIISRRARPTSDRGASEALERTCRTARGPTVCRSAQWVPRR